jgi:hypothetical protein
MHAMAHIYEVLTNGLYLLFSADPKHMPLVAAAAALSTLPLEESVIKERQLQQQ